jgi:hypothetical protein
MAGIQALVNQRYNRAQGNPNYVYYNLAANTANVCDSNGTIAGGCIFHNVTSGDNDVNCGGSQNCYSASSTQAGAFPCPPGFICRVAPDGPPQGGPGIPGLGGPGIGAQSYDGALSISNQSLVPAYKAASGWNFATGVLRN